MFINEAAKLSKTTKKAIEYYCHKGLLNPKLSDKGYRLFTAEDVEVLKKISLLRSLGVAVKDIPELLNENDQEAFQKIIEVQLFDIQRRKEQNDFLKELAASMDWEAVSLKVAAKECQQSVIERLTKAFPGFWGKYLALHFQQFLQEPIQTTEQEKVYLEICNYLDNVQFEIPDELDDYMDTLNTQDCQKIYLNTSTALSYAIDNPENWLVNNKEIVEQYLEFQKTAEYQNSDGAKLKELLKKFNEEQGYISFFIPAMRKLSPAYNEYIQKLQKADKAFLQQQRKQTNFSMSISTSKHYKYVPAFLH